jgi:hypothetical protein
LQSDGVKLRFERVDAPLPAARRFAPNLIFESFESFDRSDFESFESFESFERFEHCKDSVTGPGLLSCGNNARLGICGPRR